MGGGVVCRVPNVLPGWFTGDAIVTSARTPTCLCFNTPDIDVLMDFADTQPRHNAAPRLVSQVHRRRILWRRRDNLQPGRSTSRHEPVFQEDTLESCYTVSGSSYALHLDYALSWYLQ